LGFRSCNLKFFWFWTFMKNLTPCNLWKFRFTPCNLSKFQFIPLLIWSNFGLPPVISSISYSQNPWRSKTKNFKLQGRNPKRKFYRGKTRNDFDVRFLHVIYLTIREYNRIVSTGSCVYLKHLNAIYHIKCLGIKILFV